MSHTSTTTGQKMKVDLHLGDCLHTLRKLPDNSVDSIVTDPPYGLSKQPDMAEVLRHWLAGDDYTHTGGGFMGRSWDSFVPGPSIWRECLRVLKPGGHLLAFAGTRTMDLMGLSLRLAGFELRDSIGYAHDDESNGAPLLAWVYGSGFPKNLDVSKQLDWREKDGWVKISKAIDNLNLAELTELWINSKSANVAGVKFQRKATEAGHNTQKSGFAHGNVLLQANRKNCDALAVIAELSLIEVHHTSVETCSSAQLNVESSITESKSHATTAGKSPENREATLCMVDFSALQSAWGWQGESKVDKLKAAEALKTWLGSKPSSRQVVTNALCAALTDDLKLITLSQSKTFLSFDTTRQTACASAISVTITESTAEILISFTVDTLKSKAIDKVAGADREVIGKGASGITAGMQGLGASGFKGGAFDVTTPATDAARQWKGWGTALKPSFEPVLIARKPLAGTVAENVLAHGTGAMNIDGCRVEGRERTDYGPANSKRSAGNTYGTPSVSADFDASKGRWPANLVLSTNEDEYSLRDDVSPDQLRQLVEWMDANT